LTKEKVFSLPSEVRVIKVGTLKGYQEKTYPKTGMSRRYPVFYSYKDVEYDIDGWADVNKYLPDDFDLVFMRLKRNRTIPGWVNGSTWEGLRFKNDDVVLFWKKNEHEGDSA
jgi:hypothetical protein